MLRLTIILLVAVLLLNPAPAIANSDEVTWSRVDIPGEGRAGDNVLAPGTDITHLTSASDGTLYACGQGVEYTLYRSSDGGIRWTGIHQTEQAMTAIVTAPEDPDTIYYATEAAVFRSTDGGDTFRALSGSPGDAGSGHITITSLAVTVIDDDPVVAVATRDSDDGEFGGVYIWDGNQPFSGWLDTGVGSYDVYAVAFSPDFASDEQLVAVVTDETNTLITTKYGSADWGQTTGDAVLENSGAPVVVDTSAVIVFPDDYDAAGEYTQLVAIDAGDEEGDVYMIVSQEAPTPSAAFDLNIGAEYDLDGVDVTSLAISGPAARARLMAGAAGRTDVYFSTDGGQTWERSPKPPTGESKTYVVLDSDNNQTCAATSGCGSAISVTENGGNTWNQSGLIDTEITGIIDLAPSPQYDQDETLFLLTWGGEYSLWRSPDGGQSWVRILSTDHPGVDEIDRVALPSDYGESNQNVFLTGSIDGQPVVWYSQDNGQEFSSRETPLAVDAWAVASGRTLFIGGYDGSQGRVYRSGNGGLSYSAGAAASGQSLNSIALSPDYDDDETALVGNTDGWVYYSNDNGKTFIPLPDDATTAPLTGAISVAFDPAFDDNHTVYAASDTPDGGIYRLRLDKDTGWESIDGSLPEGSMLDRLQLADAGTLYAANFLADGGLERCLKPTYNLGPTFETVTRGLEDGATLVGLWLAAGQLWSIDTTNNRLITYRDSLTAPVTLTSPDDEAPGVGTVNSDDVTGVSLDWAALPEATGYQWQLDYETDFSSVPDGFEGESQTTRARLPDLDPATTYYWRVRATEPVLSPWSDKWSFTTSLGTGVAAPQPFTPTAGATEVNVRPVFQWSSIAGANDYELLLAADSTFEDTLISRTGDASLAATAWECDVDLSKDTTYFWKVRARGDNSNSAWSDVYAFTTESPALGILPQETSYPTTAPPTQTGTDWTKWLVIVGIVLAAIMTAILVTMIVLVVRTRRSYW